MILLSHSTTYYDYYPLDGFPARLRLQYNDDKDDTLQIPNVIHFIPIYDNAVGIHSTQMATVASVIHLHLSMSGHVYVCMSLRLALCAPSYVSSSDCRSVFVAKVLD